MRRSQAETTARRLVWALATNARRRVWALAVMLAAIGAALALAACGSSGGGSTTTGGRLTPAQQQRDQGDVVRFADCMRTHGVSNFPDPTSDPHAYKNALGTRAPAVLSAESHCGHLLPGGGLHQNQAPPPSHRQLAAELAFARCVRRHGIARFPDPSSSGGITHEIVAGAGIDLHQPAVLRAAYACVGVTHGLISRTTIAQFVAGH